ncbi:uncharacterized protein LOC124121019 [Haliotis rufescens]|uniref:uncharacterized protein LOC124121019 n=1 Tax=Haliotis rufescens TaxID=6454 RepID=UPI00201E96F2|nr:uncharacterized protein LOC124121019 [Haliotis rufescens]XP_046339957.2 uncharacterized protein LOC124121019 [Haliotis rufescens]
MNQISMQKDLSPSSGHGEAFNTPAQPQSRQHDSGLEASETQQNEKPTSSLDLDKTDSSPKTDDKNDDGQSYSFPKLSISKIQINIKDRGKKAEEIISNITQSREKSTHGGETTRKKRKDTDGTINPQVLTSDVGDPGISESQSTGRDNSEVGTVTNSPLPGTSRQSVMDPADDNQNLSKTTLTELSLIQRVSDSLKKHESGFHVKVFEIITPTVSQMLRAIESITKPRQLRHVNQTRSYMIFFYRDKGGPEIFVAGSGMAYTYVDQRSCPEFPRKIARRLLEPTTIQLDTRNVTGDTSQVRKQYIPDKGGTINVWDIIEVVVHKYIAKPKDMASILQFFQKRPSKKPSIAIKKVSVEVITRFPDILDIQKIISHFATIDRNEPTYLFGTSQNKEEDDKTFAMFDLMQEEHNKEKIKTLQENMHRRIDRYIENQSEDDIQLSCDDLDLWLRTSECRLFLETTSKWKPIKKWKECLPNFRDVLKALKERNQLISEKLLSSDVKMSLHDDAGKTMKKKQPITNFIQSHFASSDSKPYYFWCGKWLKIKAEYFRMLDDSFMSIMKEQTIDSTDIMPLPWVYSHAKKTSESKKAEETSKSKKAKETSKGKKAEETSKGKKAEESSESKKAEETSKGKKAEETSKGKKAEETSKGKKAKETSKGKKAEESSESKKAEETSKGKKAEETSKGKKAEETSESKKAEETSKGNKAEETSKGKKAEETSKGKKAEETSKGKKAEESSESKKAEETSKGKKAEETSKGKKAEETSKGKKAEETSKGKKAEESSESKKAEETSKGKKAEETSKGKKAEETSESKKAEETSKGKKAEETSKGKKAEETSKGKKAEETSKGKKAEETSKGKKAEETSKGKKAEETSKGKKAEETSKGKKVKTKIFALDTLCQFLSALLPDQKIKSEDMEVLLKSVDGVEVEKNEAGILCTYNQREYETKDQLKSFVQLFLTMNTSLTEGMYNDSYILLDKIISTTGKTSQTGFLVGDRICMKHIEMFDIIMYNQTHTYIIHVKEGFDHNTRVVASQIRNSADILFRALTSHMTKTALEKMWETFTRERQNPSGSKSQPTIDTLGEKEGMKKNYQAMKSKLDEMTKGGFINLFKKREIVYVLAVRDKGEDRTFEIGDALETQLQRKYPDRCETILHLLEEKMFIQKANSHYVVPDKFRLVTSKDQFVRNMMDDTPDEEDNRLANEEKRDDVDRIVSPTASRTGRQSASGNLTTGFDKLEPLVKYTGHASISAESPERRLTGTEEASHRISVLESCADDSSESGLTNTEIRMEEGSSEEVTHSDVSELDPTENIKSPADSAISQVSYNKADGLLWGEVYKILMDQLPHTRSSIVKLDILSLFSHFRKYQIGEKRFQLKVCFVPKSTKTFSKELKGFLERGSLKK